MWIWKHKCIHIFPWLILNLLLPPSNLWGSQFSFSVCVRMCGCASSFHSVRTHKATVLLGLQVACFRVWSPVFSESSWFWLGWGWSRKLLPGLPSASLKQDNVARRNFTKRIVLLALLLSYCLVLDFWTGNNSVLIWLYSSQTLCLFTLTQCSSEVHLISRLTKICITKWFFMRRKYLGLDDFNLVS